MGAFVSNANDINVANNYRYDQEGRLIQDLQEEIENIEWRVDGKVKKIIRTTGSTRKNLSFDYDAMGNRIAKHIEELNGTRISSTYYVLDAQGNPLSMYELNYGDTQNPQASFELTERQIYGSARLGSLKTKVDVFGSAYTAFSDVITTHAIGDRNYELSNHLGNVLTVISDKLHSVDDGNGAVASYTADLVMSCDYSPFGVTLDGRGVEGSYRYRFQGQEMDDEIKGEGNSVNYKYRMHDPRVGRFFAVDPLTSGYPYYSPYSFSGNKLIHAVELEGLEEQIVIHQATVTKPVLAVHWGGMVPLQVSSNSTLTTFPDRIDPNNCNCPENIAINAFQSYIDQDPRGTLTLTPISAWDEMDGLGGYNTYVLWRAHYAYVNQEGEVVTHVITFEHEMTADSRSVPFNNFERSGNVVYTNPNHETGDYIQKAKRTSNGKGSNKRRPDSNASGDHSVFNSRGNTTYKKNSKNPSGYDEVKRTDVKGRPHRNTDGNQIETPHTHTKGDKNVRPAKKGEDY